MSAAIETIDLTRRYGRHLALDRLNLSIAPGTIYGLIGPNGAGKTTTLRLLAGLLEPTSGQIRLLGTPLDRAGRIAQRRVGYMPDFFGVYDNLRVWEYLDFFARCYDLPAARRRATVDGLLELVDLADKRNALVQDLSRGMQQRLCLAHALVHDPPILLLDEPASGLDPRARLELRELLRTLREMGKTIILSSHILSELAEICTALGIMHQGRLVASGTIEAVRRQLGVGRRLRLTILRGLAQAEAVLRATPQAGQPTVLEESPTAPPTDAPVTARLPELHAPPRTLLVPWSGDADATAALIQRLVSAGVALLAFGEDSNDLEDLFLQITAA
ncbi:ABC transporter ATP-binding protein [Kallotenue papyrolyticum]|uniref:ABC transporter ATP-binding protein n=1 Tax=Kallotenue papyrolyticum TaxID=1325125 RepID=UPI000492D394|nr:ABC transporter ATP-binding protein [Kallotenue papyrolyticum]